MSDRSPLFFHATELLVHSMEVFRQANERKYPFIVLHLANAVELLLQDRLIDAGQSMYETTKPTPLPTLKILDLLKKERVKIPERPFLEFLIEDSHTIHHRFERPGLKTVYRYLDGVTGFMKRFLHDEYGLELADVLGDFRQTSEDIQLFGVLEGQGNVMAFLDALFELSPESAVLQAFNFVEAKFIEFSFLQANYFDPRAKKSFLRASQRNEEFIGLLDKLILEKFFTRQLVMQIDVLRSARNAAVFQEPNNPNLTDWDEALSIAKKLLIGLDKALESHYESEVDTETLPIVEHQELD